jgi:sugar lactone lactonase YvrE
VSIAGSGFPIDGPRLPEVRFGPVEARIVRASSRELTVIVPTGLEGGATAIRVEGVSGETAFIEVGAAIATGVHQVDNPAFDAQGNLYVTYSGTRGQQAPVSIYRVRPDGAREPFVSDLPNPTSLAFDPSGVLYVSSRFEGNVYRVHPDGATEVFATELGTACGLAFDAEGNLFVGDRSGSVFQVSPRGQAAVFASLPPSVAAYHLAFGPDRCLYVAGPTLAPRDPVYRIDSAGNLTTVADGFGRPQGLAFDSQGTLYVVEALAGMSGVFRMTPPVDDRAELVLSGAGLVGLAFAPAGGLVVASNDTVYRVAAPVRPGITGAPQNATVRKGEESA